MTIMLVLRPRAGVDGVEFESGLPTRQDAESSGGTLLSRSFSLEFQLGRAGNFCAGLVASDSLLGGKPEIAPPIFRDSVNFVSFEALVSHVEGLPRCSIISRDSAPGSKPVRAARVPINAINRVGRQTSTRLSEVDEFLAVVAGHSGFRSDPECAIRVTGNGRDVVVRQAPLGGEACGLMIVIAHQSLALGTDPQRSLGIAMDGVDGVRESKMIQTEPFDFVAVKMGYGIHGLKPRAAIGSRSDRSNLAFEWPTLGRGRHKICAVPQVGTPSTAASTADPKHPLCSGRDRGHESAS